MSSYHVQRIAPVFCIPLRRNVPACSAQLHELLPGLRKSCKGKYEICVTFRCQIKVFIQLLLSLRNGTNVSLRLAARCGTRAGSR